MLREGAAVGVYLVVSASRVGGVRMNMLSNISTRLCLYLNDEGELAQLLGRERLLQVALPGRGQVLTDAPTAIQFYQPAPGATGSETLTALEQHVTALNEGWAGERPAKIPMVPRELTPEAFESSLPREPRDGDLYLGLNKVSAEPERFDLFAGDALAVFPESAKQAALLYPFLIDQVRRAVPAEQLVLIDAHDALERLGEKASLSIGKKALKAHAEAVGRALTELIENGTPLRQCIVINGLTEVLDKLPIPVDQLAELLGIRSRRVQVIVLDQLSKVNGGFGLVGPLKENVDRILFGGDLGTQRFVDNLPLSARKETSARNVLHSLRDGELLDIVVPTGPEGEE